MKTTRKLFLQRHALTIAGKELSKHEPVLLVNAKSNQVIDADCNNRSLALVSREQGAESWRTGVDWYLDPQPDGSWRIYNQGQASHLLGGASGAAGLFGKDAAQKSQGVDWMLYEHSESGTFALRPQAEAWLTQTDDGLSLEKLSTDIAQASLWSLERPSAATSAGADTANLPLLIRVRRFLGRIKRRIL